MIKRNHLVAFFFAIVVTKIIFVIGFLLILKNILLLIHKNGDLLC